MKPCRRHLISQAVLLAMLLGANAASAQTTPQEQVEGIDSETPVEPEWFKLHVGLVPYTLAMQSISDEKVRGGGFFGSIGLGAGAQVGEHLMVSAQVGLGFSSNISGEVAVSAQGWQQSGLIFWGGGGYALVPVWCEGFEDPSCPPAPESHGPSPEGRYASGPMLHAGLGYRWSFSDDEWAFMLGIGEGLAHLRYDPGDHPEATGAQLETIAGWYISVPMVRYFLEW